MKYRDSLASSLETWFAKAKRDMPWRRKATPYRCWLSEIMMQQTTYASVLPYYERFLARFPTVKALAAADESDVLKAWEGLGYYARARNLHKAAKQIVAVDDVATQRGRDIPVACKNKEATFSLATGMSRPLCSSHLPSSSRLHWPTSSSEWSSVPGVGPYTAAALASVLNGERTPVVDGNVARVFARVWELKDDFHKQPARAKLAERLQPEIDRAKVPGDFNQAMMELGALVCTPTNPSCGVCPLAAMCAARKKGTQADYPKKAEKKQLPVRKRKVVIIRDGEGRVLLVQNREGGLLKGLWDLPTIEELGAQVQVFSHFRLEQQVFAGTGTVPEFRDPGSVPLTTAARKALALW